MDKLLQDPVLSDIRSNVTLEELQLLHAKACGLAWTLRLLLFNYQHIHVEVTPDSTVVQLKRAIQTAINNKDAHRYPSRHISWKHIWKNWCLAFQGNTLTNPTQLLSDYGIKDGSELMLHSILQDRIDAKRERRHNKSTRRRRPY